MRGKIKTARRKASKLHGAEATYVSLVDAGANETPFTIIKSADGAKAMPIAKRGKTTAKKSHKPVAKKKKSAAPETTTETLIAKMVFSANHFEDEAAVEAFIESAEWEAETLNITKNDDGDFEARANDLTDDDFTKIAKVELDDEDGTEGVEAFVGQREVAVKTSEDEDEDADQHETVEDEDEATTETKSDDDEDEDEDEDEADDEADAAEAETETKGKGKKKPTYSKAKKAAPKAKLSKRAQFLAKRAAEKEAVTKFDAWDARFSSGNTLAKTLRDGMEWDGTPPGYHDVQCAFNAAMANIVGDDGLGEGKQEALNKAAAEFAEIVGGLDTFFDNYVEKDEETLAKAFEDEDEREAVAKWAEEFADFANGGDDEPAVEKKAVKKAALQSTASEPDMTNVVKMVTDALSPLQKQVEGIGETVEALSTRAPTKKATDASDGSPAEPRKVETKAKDAADQRKATKAFMQKTAERGMFG